MAAPSPRRSLSIAAAVATRAYSSAISLADRPSGASAGTDGMSLTFAAGAICGRIGYESQVGHTDEKGGEERNAPLSQARAEKVVADLVERGVARSLKVSNACALLHNEIRRLSCNFLRRITQSRTGNVN